MLRTGDLVFSVVGKDTNAISAVTVGYRGAQVNHMGVLVATQFGNFVLEAFYPEVRLTKYEVFARRSESAQGELRLMHGRLASEYQGLIAPAVRYGLQQRDVPYDQLYLTGEGALYCSELVVDMFKHANDGTPFFAETPMSFRDVSSGEIHQDWVDYYNYFGMPVPEGEPGSNPGEISLDSRVQIFNVFGPIPGLV